MNFYELIGVGLVSLFVFGICYPLAYIVVLHVWEAIHNLWFNQICDRFNIDARSRLFRATEAVADGVDWLFEVLFEWYPAVLMSRYRPDRLITSGLWAAVRRLPVPAAVGFRRRARNQISES